MKKSVCFTVFLIFFNICCAFQLPGSIVINLSEDGVQNRSILANVDMTISSYDIKGTGPDGSTFERLDWTGTKLEVTDLMPGSWEISVQAKNNDDPPAVIAEKTTVIIVTAGTENPVDIAVTPVEGEGNLRLVASWRSGSLTFPVIYGYLEDSSGKVVCINPFIGKDNSRSSTSTLKNGYYQFYLYFYDGERQLYSGYFTDIRIVAGKETFAEFGPTGSGE